MRAILLLGVSTLLGVLPLACAETEGAAPSRAPDDAGVDALEGTDGGDGGDAGPTETDGGCSDCAWFPASCSKGALCTVSVDALDPRTVLFAFDVHGDEVTAVGSYGSVVDFTSGSWRRSGVGTPDTLRGIARLGGDVWAASSVEGVFIREASGGATGWTEHQAGGPTYFYWNNLPVTDLFSEPTGTWVWATTATSCAPLYSSEGVGLVRLRRQPDWLELETVIQNRPPMSTCLTMNALDGAGGTLWVAGDKGVLYKVTDLEASPPVVTLERSETSRSLLGVWAEPTGHVFVVGKDGTVQHRPPGGVFAPLGEGVPPVAYHAVRGTSATDVWIAGEDATVMHYDGQRWTRVPIAGLGDRRPTLRAIAAIAPDRVWVAGDNVLLGLAREDGSRP